MKHSAEVLLMAAQVRELACALRGEDFKALSSEILKQAEESVGPAPEFDHPKREEWKAQAAAAQDKAVNDWYEAHPLKDRYVAEAYWKIKETADLIATIDPF